MIAWGSPYLDYDGEHPTVDVASKQDWIAVKGSGWKGCWVPFKASSTTNDLRPVGQGCDIVVLYAHGGGFVCGHPLQTIDVLRDLVKAVHDQSGLKVGILSIDYSTFAYNKKCSCSTMNKPRLILFMHNPRLLYLHISDHLYCRFLARDAIPWSTQRKYCGIQGTCPGIRRRCPENFHLYVIFFKDTPLFEKYSGFLLKRLTVLLFSWRFSRRKPRPCHPPQDPRRLSRTGPPRCELILVTLYSGHRPCGGDSVRHS